MAMGKHTCAMALAVATKRLQFLRNTRIPTLQTHRYQISPQRDPGLLPSGPLVWRCALQNRATQRARVEGARVCPGLNR